MKSKLYATVAGAFIAGVFLVAQPHTSSAAARPPLTAVMTSSEQGMTPLHAVAVAANADDFLAAAGLQASDLPGSLGIVGQNYLTATDLTDGAPSGIADLLNSAGFLRGYVQALQTSDVLSIITGGPAGGAAALSLFSSSDGAAAFQQFEIQNASSIGQQIAGASSGGFSVDAVASLSTASIGDESTGVELSGTGSFGGQTVSLVADAIFARRGAVQYTVIIAGLGRQQSALEKMAAAVDAHIVSALPLLQQ